MANIWEQAISIFAGNLNSGLSYLITTVISYRRNGRSLCKRSFSATFRSGEMRCSSSSIGSCGISRRCISASGATAAARFSLFALAMGASTAVIADVNSHFKIPCMDVISLNWIWRSCHCYHWRRPCWWNLRVYRGSRSFVGSWALRSSAFPRLPTLSTWQCRH